MACAVSRRAHTLLASPLRARRDAARANRANTMPSTTPVRSTPSTRHVSGDEVCIMDEALLARSTKAITIVSADVAHGNSIVALATGRRQA